MAPGDLRARRSPQAPSDRAWWRRAARRLALPARRGSRRTPAREGCSRIPGPEGPGTGAGLLPLFPYVPRTVARRHRQGRARPGPYGPGPLDLMVQGFTGRLSSVSANNRRRDLRGRDTRQPLRHGGRAAGPASRATNVVADARLTPGTPPHTAWRGRAPCPPSAKRCVGVSRINKSFIRG